MRVLGEGISSIVYGGIDLKTNMKVAVKIMKQEYMNKFGDLADKDFKKEVKILKKLKGNSNIVLILDHGRRGQIAFKEKLIKTSNYVVLEFIEDSLLDICKSSGPLPESTARSYFIQMLDGVEAMHNNSVYHRDIKLENMLVDQN